MYRITPFIQTLKTASKSKHQKTNSNQDETTYPPWIDLPKDITANILHRLGAVEILLNAEKVCTTWQNVCKDPFMWRVVDMRNNGCLDEARCDLWKMCFHAMLRSKKELIDLNSEYFGNDQLLTHVVERGPQLRQLRIAHCFGVTGEDLVTKVAALPLLEQLHLAYMKSTVSAENIEAIGHACPALKSFTFNEKGYERLTIEDDGLALAVARSMPGLLQLQLIGDRISNKGLEAVLDGCPRLESLDLRKCFNLVQDCNLGKRCSSQLKHLRRPLDSTDDEWVPVLDPADDEESESEDSDESSDTERARMIKEAMWDAYFDNYYMMTSI